METVSRKTLWAVTAALVALAIYGSYQGWRRSAAPDDDAPVALSPAAPPVNGARNAAPFVEPPPTFTEDQIRDIARQEVRSALAREAESAEAAAPQPLAPVAPPVRPPAPATTPTPRPATEPANPPPQNAPLF